MDHGGFYPRQVQEVLNAKANRGRVMEILKRDRQQVVDGVTLEGFLYDETAKLMKRETQNLPDLDSWLRKILNGKSLDFRAVLLLAKWFGALVQIVQQMVDGDMYMLRDVDGFGMPLRETGRILWTGACHFEAVVSIVSSKVSNYLSVQ